jgi:hypothetical protein
MNRIIVVCLTAVVLVACNHREEVSENKEAKAMLQGIWIDAEGGDVSFRVQGDTIYYADSTSMPAYFRVMGDSLVLASGASYGIVKQLPHLFWFKNQNGDVLKFSKSDDPAAHKSRTDPVRHLLPAGKRGINQRELRERQDMGRGRQEHGPGQAQGHAAQERSLTAAADDGDESAGGVEFLKGSVHDAGLQSKPL